MISSATKILLKRSGVPGRVPSLADLKLGELGVNYADGKIYLRQQNGEVDRIIEPGQGAVIGKTIFVSVNGNDNNAGTNERDALRSIKKAAELAQPGDSIKVYPGQYVEDNPIRFRDKVSVEGMELRNVLVTPANPSKDLYQVGEAFHATNHSFVSNQDSTDGAAIITFRPLEGTASDRYFDAARLIRDNLDFIAGEAVGFLTSGYSGFAAGQRSQDGARALELNQGFITEEAFQYINSPDYKGPEYINPDLDQCRSDLGDILNAWRYDLISDGNSASVGAGLTYYAPIKFFRQTDITDLFYNNETGDVVIETAVNTQAKVGDEIKLADIRLDCDSFRNEFFITGFKYDNVSGVATVSLPFIHNIQPGEPIKLDGLQFDCPAYGASPINVTNFVYDELTGASKIELAEPHNLSEGDSIELRDLQFDCPAYGGKFTDITNLTYDPASGLGTVSFVANNTDLVAGDEVLLYDIKMTCPPYGNAISVVDFDYDNFTGISSVRTQRPHGLQPGDSFKLENLRFVCPNGSGVTTDFFPSEGAQNIFSVISTPTPNRVVTRVGTSTIPHTYASGGNLFVGITTNMFPDGTRAKGNRFEIVSMLSNTSALINIGVSTIPHVYESGGRLQYGKTNELEILTFDYTHQTGLSTVTITGNHGLSKGDLVKLKGLEFSCTNSPGITTTIFPDGTRASLNIFKAGNIINNNTFEVNVGRVDFAHTYQRGGYAYVGVTTNIFPDGTQGYNFTVDGVVSPTEITINAGISSIQHDYVRGGTLFSGKTNERDIANFSYTNTTGQAILTLPEPEELYTGDLVKLQGLEFTCTNSPGITTTIFPDGNRKLFPVLERLNPTQFRLDIGKSAFKHNYVRGTGAAFVGITTDIFPDGRQRIFDVIGVPTPNSVATRVGASTIPHNYVGGGTLQVGINTDIFPGDSEVSPLGDTFVINAITEDDELIINVGPSTINHRYASGGIVKYGISPGGTLQHVRGPGVKQATVSAIDFERQIAQSVINNRPWGSFIAQETSRIDRVDYDNTTGFATITAPGINVQVGDSVRLSDIQFKCSDEYAGLTTTFFPDNTRGDGNYFQVDRRVGVNTFETFIGISSIPHTYRQGGNAYRYRQNLVNITYDNVSGLASVRSTAHGFGVDDIIELGDIGFACTSFTPDYDIENVEYDNVTGLTVITTTEDNTIQIGDKVRLDDIELSCPSYGNDKDITGFNYNNATGLSVVTTEQNHGITLREGPAISVVDAEYDKVSGVVTVTTSQSLDLLSTRDNSVVLRRLEFVCPGGSGITTSFFPTEEVAYPLTKIISPTKFAAKVGSSTIDHTYLGGGTAAKIDRADVKLEGIKFDCPSYGNDKSIANFLYDNVSGNSLITLASPHGIEAGDTIKLRDIKFQCPPYGNDFTVTAADYNEFTGIIRITTNKNLNRSAIGDKIRVKDLQFDCNSGTSYEPIEINGIFFDTGTRVLTLTLPTRPAGINAGSTVKLDGFEYVTGLIIPETISYPDGRDASYNQFEVLDVTPNTDPSYAGLGYFDVEIFLPEVQDPLAIFTQQKGKMFVGVTTNIFPENVGKEGGFYSIESFPADNQFEIQVGTSTIPHTYIRNGQAFLGITTNFFPNDSKQNSPKGDTFTVIDVPNTTQLRINVGPSSIPHVYDEGGKVLVGLTTDIYPDGKGSQLFPVVGLGTTSNELLVRVGTSTIPHNYVSGGTLFVGITTTIFPDSSKQNSPRGNIFTVLGKDDECNADQFIVNVGPSSITHDYVQGGTVTTGVTTNRFPDGTNGFSFPVLQVLDTDNFLVNVGPSSIRHTYTDGGFTRRLDTPITDLTYNNETGRATITVANGHKANIGDLVKLRDIRLNCSGYGREADISDVEYNNVSGQLVVTTTNNHGISAGDIVKLSAIQMDCAPYNNNIAISTASYDNTTGQLFITTLADHNLAITDDVKLDALKFTCPGGSGITTDIFPDGTAASLNIFPVTSIEDADTFSVNVGTSTIPHSYFGGGEVFVGVTTNIFPGTSRNSPRGSFLEVSEIPALNQITVNVGPSSITHSYVRGGKVQPGITTDIFPDGSQGDFFVVNNIVDENTFVFNAGISTIAHTYDVGGYVSKYATYQSKKAQVIDERVIRVSGDCKAVEARIQQLAGITTNILNNGPSVAPGGESIDITLASYNEQTGALIISVADDTEIAIGNIIEVKGLIFECESKGFTDQKVFPDTKKFLYEVTEVLSPRNFIINVGAIPGLPHKYVSGGTVKPGIRHDVTSATFDTDSGKLTVVTETKHRLVEHTGVNLQGLRFTCPSGGNNNQGGELSFPDGRPANVTASTYDNVTGLLRVTTDKPHQLYRDAFVRLEGLVFACLGGSLTYPAEPDKLLRVTGVESPYTYQVQLTTSKKRHTYVSGGKSNPGTGNYAVSKVLSEKSFEVMMAPNTIPHTYVGGGSVASVFATQQINGINLFTEKCADDVKKIYLAVAHDITRGGNWKSVEAGKRYYDGVGQVQFIAGGEIDQTVQTLEYSLNVVRCVINNVNWGGIPRGKLTSVEKRYLNKAKSTQTSVVRFAKPIDSGDYTTTKSDIVDMTYDQFTGIASFRTSKAHALLKNNPIRLDGIEMSCKNSTGITTTIFPDGTQGNVFDVDSVIQDNEVFRVGFATYTNTTGKLIISTLSDTHKIPVGSLIRMQNLRFQCLSTGSLATLKYPTNPDVAYEVLEVPTNRSLVVNVGVSTLEHTWSPIFTPAVGEEPVFQELPTLFTTHVGTVGFEHSYVRGGTAWKVEPFQFPADASQLLDLSIQDDPLQLTNSTPNACANVFSAIENAVGVVTTIVNGGFENSGISTRYPGNDGKGVATMEEMSSQGVGNIIKGPYIRNCTNFVPKSIGMRMDGFDAEPGDEISNGVQGSSNVDSFTQFNPGGIGCSVSNGTYQQLVSIFTICCDQAIVADSGAQLDLTNSNSSFGRLGLVARGIGDAKSKCIDRYTGTVAVEAEIEDDTVIITGVGNKRPYDGQGIFFGELFREVVRIVVTDGGSGYDDANPPRAFVDLPTGPSGIKAEVSPTVRDGVVVSIELISNGNQYRDISPKVTIDPPRDPEGRQAEAKAITEPLYYDVDSSSEPAEGTVTVVFKQRLNNTVSVGTTVFFSRLSLQIASSHSFEYIGAGNEIDGARPSQGGVPIKENEVVKVDGGSIVYTSTDQAGNFNIGDDFVINQFTGTITGRSFDQSVLNKVTPLIIALDS